MNGYKISNAQLEKETNSEVRNLLRYELNAALSIFISRDTPVYLEGFGILFPHFIRQTRSKTKGTLLFVWSETTRSVGFEKCYDLVPLHRERFPTIVETREITQFIYPRLPIFISSKYDERTIRRFLRGVIDGIKQRVVEDGHCDWINSLGELFALHNRQGDGLVEWYAGADIFLMPTFREVIETSERVRYERPVLSNAWEPLEAAGNTRIWEGTIDIGRELSRLGYDASLLPVEQEPTIHVAAFKSAGASLDGVERVIFCSNGLRRLGQLAGQPRSFGNEIVFQLKTDILGHETGDLTDYIGRVFTTAWMLMQSAQSKSLRCGAGLSVDVPLFPSLACSSRHGPRRDQMRTIFISPFQMIRTEQLSAEGPFNFVSMIGITDDEQEVARNHSPAYLLTLLKHRDLDQVTNPRRPSILARTKLSHNFGVKPSAAQSLHENPVISSEADSAEALDTTPEAITCSANSAH